MDFRVLAIISIIAAAVIFGACGDAMRHREEPYSMSEKEWAGAPLRFAAYEEVRDYMQATAGAVYKLERKRTDEPGWTPAVVYHHDDPHPITENNILIVNDRVAAAFVRKMFAVTVDGGETWHRWEPDRQTLKSNGIGVSFSIEKVIIHEDGTGVMNVNSYEDVRHERQLCTNDYGLTWAQGTACSEKL